MRTRGLCGGCVAALLGMSGSLYALDVADVVGEWTPDGKTLAAERGEIAARDEMIPYSGR